MDDQQTPNCRVALARAVDVAGGQSALARAIGVRQGLVWAWLNRTADGVPPTRCPQIESAVDGAVTCEELRPDVTWHRGRDDRVTGYTVPVDSADAREVA